MSIVPDCGTEAGSRFAEPEEVGHVRGLGRVVHLLRWADLLDLALAHHRQAIAHGQRFLLVVGDVHERDADLAVQLLQLELERTPQLGVERAERLVEQQHPGSQHQRTGQRDPLLLTARQLVRLAGRELAEPDEVERLADAAAAFVLRAVAGTAARNRRCRRPMRCGNSA